MEYAFALFFLLLIDQLIEPGHLAAEGHPKGIKLKTFPRGYVISLSGVVVRSIRVGPKVLGSNPTQLFYSFFLFFFSRFFCVVIFYKYIPN